MAKAAKIDLILHSEGVGCMVHSARTDAHVAFGAATKAADIQRLIAARDRIKACLGGPNTLKPTDLEAIGSELASVLLSGPVDKLYDSVSSKGRVQMSICVDETNLKSIPWEFLLWPDIKSAPDSKRTVCRLVTETHTKSLSPMKLDKGVRIMLVASAPLDQPAVEWVETEAILKNHLAVYAPKTSGAPPEFRVCEASDVTSVRAAVQAFNPHIVHFIGHGAPGALLFTRHQSNNAHPVAAAAARNALVSDSCRLLILSACDTANVGDDLTSMAERFVVGGVPAVVANQMPITLRSVSTFCGALYEELLKSGDIDQAVNVGRIAMGVQFDNINTAALEWGVPVLYRRPNCSLLFSVPK